MSSFPTDCFNYDSTWIQLKNSTVFAGINACRAAANTTYCFPPNGTRICAPSTGIPVYWPPSYYADDAKVGVTADLDKEGSPLLVNTGHWSTSFTPYIYDNVADFIPGVRHEKIITIYIIEDEQSDTDLRTYAGPTVTLVKTAEFSSMSTRTRATATATATSIKAKDNADDGASPLSRAGIIGVVIASIIGSCLLFILCGLCCKCSRGPKRSKPRDNANVVPYTQRYQEVQDRLRGVQDRRTRTENLRLAERAGPARPARVAPSVPQERAENARPETWQEAADIVAWRRAQNARVKRLRERLERVREHMDEAEVAEVERVIEGFERATGGEEPPVYAPETLPPYQQESPPSYRP